VREEARRRMTNMVYGDECGQTVQFGYIQGQGMTIRARGLHEDRMKWRRDGKV
jgi:hypothetical protein